MKNTNKEYHHTFRVGNRILEKAKYIVNICLADLCLVFIKPFLKFQQNRKPIWIFGTGDDIYSNNIAAFYEYINANAKDNIIYWICDRENRQRIINFIPDQKFLDRGSILNYIYIGLAQVGIIAYSDFDIAPGYFRLHKKHRALVVCVSHGFEGIKGLPKDYYSKVHADLICAASNYEKKIKVQYCGADPNQVIVTGYARYDLWMNKSLENRKKKKIFIMPTWRPWYEKSGVDLKTTEVFTEYKELISRLSEKDKFEITFKIHPRLADVFGEEIEELNDAINLNPNITIKDAIETADYVITDYSSIFWDAIYLRKKTILFWFDAPEYRERLGLIANESFYDFIGEDVDSTIEMIKKLETSKCSSELVDRFFDWNDHNNCQRIYTSIMNCIVNQCD